MEKRFKNVMNALTVQIKKKRFIIKLCCMNRYFCVIAKNYLILPKKKKCILDYNPYRNICILYNFYNINHVFTVA